MPNPPLPGARWLIDLMPIWYHHVNLVGAYGHGMNTWDGVTKRTFEWVYDFYKAGKLDISGLITHCFPMADYKEEAIKVMFKHA